MEANNNHQHDSGRYFSVEVKTFTSSDCKKSVTCGIDGRCFQSDCGKGFCDNMGKSFSYLKTQEARSHLLNLTDPALLSNRWIEVKNRLKIRLLI